MSWMLEVALAMVSSIAVHVQMINSDGCEECSYPEVDPKKYDLDERMNVSRKIVIKLI